MFKHLQLRLIFAALVFCATSTNSLSSEFRCNITNYVRAGSSLEVLKSWIPENFTIAKEEHARVGYEGKEVTYFNETSSKFTYQIHIYYLQFH